MSSSSPPNNSQQALRLVLDEGIARDLFYARSCDAILRVVGTHAGVINDAGIGSFFGLLQRFLADEMTLALSRIFDRSGGHNNTRSLAEVVRLLRAHKFPVLEPNVATDELARQGVEGVERTDDGIRTAIVVRLEALLSEAKSLLSAVVERRDTMLAHHDVKARTREETPLLRSEVLRLFRLATDALAITCLPLLRIAHVVNGRFMLQADSRTSGVQVLKLLRKADVVPEDWLPSADLWERE